MFGSSGGILVLPKTSTGISDQTKARHNTAVRAKKESRIEKLSHQTLFSFPARFSRDAARIVVHVRPRCRSASELRRTRQMSLGTCLGVYFRLFSASRVLTRVFFFLPSSLLELSVTPVKHVPVRTAGRVCTPSLHVVACLRVSMYPCAADAPIIATGSAVCQQCFVDSLSKMERRRPRG